MIKDISLNILKILNGENSKINFLMGIHRRVYCFHYNQTYHSYFIDCRTKLMISVEKL